MKKQMLIGYLLLLSAFLNGSEKTGSIEKTLYGDVLKNSIDVYTQASKYRDKKFPHFCSYLLCGLESLNSKKKKKCFLVTGSFSHTPIESQESEKLFDHLQASYKKQEEQRQAQKQNKST